MPLLNDFLVGADPEFVVLSDAGDLQIHRRPEKYAPWGIDHGGWVIEPHPKPETSVRELVKNLKASMNDFATVAPVGKWRAGAYLAAPQRPVTLGGHVHIDQKTCSGAQLDGLDLFTQHLEALDVLPRQECETRRAGLNYGRYGDVRVEHGHFEYRTLPSWLFSQRVTKICLAGVKLTAIDPDAPKETLGATTKGSSIPKLKGFFERFRHKDEDADWILSSRMLDKKLVIDPSRDLRNVWKVEPQKEAPRWKEEAEKKRAQDLLKVGEYWPNGLPYKRLETQINRTLCRWVLPEWVQVDDNVRRILRDYIEAGGVSPLARVQEREGLLFLPHGRRPVNREDDEFDF